LPSGCARCSIAQAVLIQAQPVATVRIEPDLADHPPQREVTQIVVGIAAAHVRMHAGEPHLRDALGIGGAPFVPQHRMEGVALVVEGDRVARALHARREILIGKPMRVEDAVDHGRQLVDRQAHGIDRVPDAHEPDRGGEAVVAPERLGRRNGPQKPVPQPSGEPGDGRVIVAATIALVGELDPGFQPRMRVQPDLVVAAPRHRFAAVEDAALGDQSCERARGERAPAEPEDVDVIAVPVVPAQELVEVPDVARQAPAERAAENLERPEAGRADAIVVKRDLVVVAEIERLIQPPHVGLIELGWAVPGAVGEQHDIAAAARGCHLGAPGIGPLRRPGHGRRWTACLGHCSHPLPGDAPDLNPRA
jgi:hypothetical protein